MTASSRYVFDTLRPLRFAQTLPTPGVLPHICLLIGDEVVPDVCPSCGAPAKLLPMEPGKTTEYVSRGLCKPDNVLTRKFY
jgi:hypothetical protein